DFQNVHTVIGADATMVGDLSLEGGLIIYGTVEGNIQTSGPVRVAKSGVVKGNISSSDIQLHGNVYGDVTVKARAVLGGQCTLEGDLTYQHLLIEEGARFTGQCRLAAAESSDGE
ncbi:MAG: polymer-forming cytoskeletal protein, partial [FCB group bacterium]|nr:polymer-forming cytoskeletal protein [FCB group bacterium]